MWRFDSHGLPSWSSRVTWTTTRSTTKPVLGPIRDLPTICDAVGRRPRRRGVLTVASTRPSWTAFVAFPGSIAVDVVPRYYDLMGWQAQLGDLDGLTVVNLADPPGIVGRATKRLLDLVGGSVLLLAAPLLGISALVVKATSPGAVLFRQPRLGRDRRVFQVLKMRTMYVQPDPAPAPSQPGEATTAAGDEESRASAGSCGGPGSTSFPNSSTSCSARCLSSGHGHSCRMSARTYRLGQSTASTSGRV